jgi:arylformamidase
LIHEHEEQGRQAHRAASHARRSGNRDVGASLGSTRIFLHYTQEELNRNFDQRTWAKNALELIARLPQLAQATRERFAHRTERYGVHADEVLDIFPAPGGSGLVQVFVHGGAWKNFSKDDYSFVADGFVPAGVHTVVLNFSKLPTQRLPAVVDQVARGIAWVRDHAADFGGDPAQIHVSSQSSGSHLAACALQTGRLGFVRAAALVSGPYYLEPVVLSHRAEYVKLEAHEVKALSPGLHAERIPCPVLMAYAENDTDEFRRQTQAFAGELERTGKLQKLLLCPGVNHFELMEKYADPAHALVRGILAQMGVAPTKRS